MRKRIIALLLIAGIFMSVGFTEAANNPQPSLTFDGTTAYCNAVIRRQGANINVTLSLWKGSNQLISWGESGTSMAVISQTCQVEVGVTYTLKLNGTINGVAFPEARVIRTNYEMNK